MINDYRRYIGRQVLVQLEEHTVTGTLIRESTQALTLDHAALLPDQGEATPMDGDVVIDRYHILWTQVA